jgi:hypothetical protein
MDVPRSRPKTARGVEDRIEPATEVAGDDTENTPIPTARKVTRNAIIWEYCAPPPGGLAERTPLYRPGSS